MKMTPKGLEQSPMKKVNHVPKKVETGKSNLSTNDSVNWLDLLRLLIGKKVQNAAFNEFEISKGKVAILAGGATGTFGMLAWVNWTQLFMGNWIEIIKLGACLAVIGVGFLVKK